MGLHDDSVRFGLEGWRYRRSWLLSVGAYDT